MPRSRLVAPLVVDFAALRKLGQARKTARAWAQVELDDVNFGWWALASAFAFLPSAALAIAADAFLERVAGWSSPSALGMFLMLGPWALVIWFLVRAVATGGSAKVGMADDIGVVCALVAAGACAIAIT